MNHNNNNCDVDNNNNAMVRESGGVVQRQYSSGEYQTLLSTAGHTSTPTAFEKEMEMIHQLDLLPPEEQRQLAGFSANDVEEMVQRNQELAEEVYRVTQQRNTAQELLKASLLTSFTSSSSSMSPPAITKHKLAGSFSPRRRTPLSAKEEDVLNSIDSVNHPPSQDVFLRLSSGRLTLVGSGPVLRASQSDSEKENTNKDEGSVWYASSLSFSPSPRGQLQHDSKLAASHHTTTTVSDGNEAEVTSRKREREEEGADRAVAVVFPRETEDGNTSIPFSAVSDALQTNNNNNNNNENGITAIEESVEKLIRAVLEKSTIRRQHTDSLLSRDFIQLLRQNGSSLLKQGGDDNDPNPNVEVQWSRKELPLALIELCTSQAVERSALAMEFQKYQQEHSEAVDRENWEKAQAVLLQSVDELQALFTLPVEKIQKALETEVETIRAAVKQETVVVEEAEWLERLVRLLQQASQKDLTIQQLLQVSRERQRQFVSQKEKKARRKWKKIRKLIDEATVLRQQGGGGGATRVSAGTTPAMASPVIPSSSSLAAPTPFYLPVSTAEGEIVKPPPRKDFPLDITSGHSDGDSEEEEGSEEEDDDEGVALREQLQQQLKIEQARSRQLAHEVHRERLQQMALLERVWIAETQAEDALKEKEAALLEKGTMFTKAQYEALEQQINQLQQQEKQLQEQVTKTVEENRRQEEEMAHLHDRLRSQYSELDSVREEEQRRYQGAMHQYQVSLKERNQLQVQADSWKSRLEAVEQQHYHLSTQLQQSQARVYQLSAELDHLKEQFMTSPDTQALLLSLYPGDTALEEEKRLLEHYLQLTRQQQEQWSTLEKRAGEQEAQLRTMRIELEKERQLRQEAEVTVEQLYAERRKEYGEDREIPLQALQAKLEVQEGRVHDLQASLKEAEERETELKKKVDLLSSDPVSACARRYGLKACLRFEDQLEELHQLSQTWRNQCNALQGQLVEHQDTIERQQDTIVSLQKKEEALTHRLEAEEAAKSLLEENIHSLEARRSELENTLQETTTALTSKQRALQDKENEIQQLYDTQKRLETTLQKCKEEAPTVLSR